VQRQGIATAGKSRVAPGSDYGGEVASTNFARVSPVVFLGGLFLPGTISDKIQSAYRTHLFGDPTVPDLPDDRPRIVIYFIATRFNPDHSVGIHL